MFPQYSASAGPDLRNYFINIKKQAGFFFSTISQLSSELASPIFDEEEVQENERQCSRHLRVQYAESYTPLTYSTNLHHSG